MLCFVESRNVCYRIEIEISNVKAKEIVLHFKLIKSAVLSRCYPGNQYHCTCVITELGRQVSQYHCTCVITELGRQVS